MEKSEEHLCPSQMHSPVTLSKQEVFAHLAGWEKTTTEKRGPGVKATGRKERGLFGGQLTWEGLR